MCKRKLHINWTEVKDLYFLHQVKAASLVEQIRKTLAAKNQNACLFN